MTSSDYRVEWRETYAVFTITRPKKLNAITNAVLQGLENCLDEIGRRGLRGLVLAGEGDAFSAGTDLEEGATLSAEQGLAKCDRARALFHRLHEAPITSAAAIRGLAFGGGLELAMACTFRVAGPEAKLALPEIKLAVLPAYGGTQMLAALVGRARAADLMLTGRTVGTDEALQMGLVSRAVAAGEELGTATALVERVTGYSQLAVDAVRRCLQAADEAVTEKGLAVEAEVLRGVMSSEDAAEGLNAFLEKRKPRFRHR